MCPLMGLPINPRRGMLVVTCSEQCKPAMVESLQKHKFDTLTAKATSHEDRFSGSSSSVSKGRQR